MVPRLMCVGKNVIDNVPNAEVCQSGLKFKWFLILSQNCYHGYCYCYRKTLTLPC